MIREKNSPVRTKHRIIPLTNKENKVWRSYVACPSQVVSEIEPVWPCSDQFLLVYPRLPSFNIQSSTSQETPHPGNWVVTPCGAPCSQSLSQVTEVQLLCPPHLFSATPAHWSPDTSQLTSHSGQIVCLMSPLKHITCPYLG